MTMEPPTFLLEHIAWPRINLNNTQLEHPLAPNQVFTWLTRHTLGFHHEGTSSEVRVIVTFTRDYPPDAVRPIELDVAFFAVFVASCEVTGDEVAAFVASHAALTL